MVIQDKYYIKDINNKIDIDQSSTPDIAKDGFFVT